MKDQCTGVILAGGENSRFARRNKAFIKIKDKRILDRINGVFKELFKEILLVTKDPLPYIQEDIQIAADLFPIRSSLTGIHAWLFYATTPYVFFAACDTPFLQKEMVETILDHIEPGSDVIIPQTEAGLEPLCAVYSKNCLSIAERYLVHNKLKISRVFQRTNVKKIPEKVLRLKDPNLISFFNINTPDDLATAEKMFHDRPN